MKICETKYTTQDTLNMCQIQHELSKAYIRKTFRTTKGNMHSMRTGTTDQPRGRQECFGYVKVKGKSVISAKTKRYPLLWHAIKTFMRMHKPDFIFTSAYVNINTVCHPHVDKGNIGNSSVIVGFGNYTGGDTVVYDEDGRENVYDISKNSIEFDACAHLHESKTFVGNRISIVYFCVNH